MKTKLFILLLLIISCSLKAQIIKSKLDIVGGVSAREFIHGGFRYQYTEISQVGFYIGNDLELKADENNTTYCFDHMVHFGKLSYRTNRPSWYARQGYTFSKNIYGAHKAVNFNYLNLSLGHEYAFNDWFGINFDLGAMWQFRKYQVKPELDAPIDNRWKMFGLARLQFFVSF